MVQPASLERACTWNGSCFARAIPGVPWLIGQAEGCLGVQETQAVSKPPLQQREFGSIPYLPGCVWVKEHSGYRGCWLLWERAGVGGKSRRELLCKKIAFSFLWGSGPCDFQKGKCSVMQGNSVSCCTFSGSPLTEIIPPCYSQRLVFFNSRNFQDIVLPIEFFSLHMQRKPSLS